MGGAPRTACGPITAIRDALGSGSTLRDRVAQCEAIGNGYSTRVETVHSNAPPSRRSAAAPATPGWPGGSAPPTRPCLAVGESSVILRHPPLTFSSCFNSDGKGLSAEWQHSRRRLVRADVVAAGPVVRGLRVEQAQVEALLERVEQRPVDVCSQHVLSLTAAVGILHREHVLLCACSLTAAVQKLRRDCSCRPCVCTGQPPGLQLYALRAVAVRKLLPAYSCSRDSPFGLQL